MHTTITAMKARRRNGDARVTVGPQDHGRRMSLARFARATALPGFHYELSNGAVEVTDIPDIAHHRIVRLLNRAVTLYEAANPNVIHSVAGGAEAKIELWGSQSERHPDLSMYLTPPPDGVAQPWDRWIPDIVIEVVSSASARRDYEEKRADYLAAGVREYWIIDPRKQTALILVRRADAWLEKKLTRRGKWRTRLLPGFALGLTKVFEKPRRRSDR